jgi:hypothetical protein
MYRPRCRRFSYPVTPKARAFQVPPPRPSDSLSATSSPHCLGLPPHGTAAGSLGPEHPLQTKSHAVRPGLHNHALDESCPDRAAPPKEDSAAQQAAAMHDVFKASQGCFSLPHTLGMIGVAEAGLWPEGHEPVGGLGDRQLPDAKDDGAEDDTLSLDEEIKQILRRDA